MTTGSISFEAVLLCSCGCCREAVERIRHQRTWWDGCSCLYHQQEERCGCQLCKYVLEHHLNG